MSILSDRLQILGQPSYEAYLRSPHWSNVKQAYTRSNRPHVCAVCGTAHIELHHHDYSKLGIEQPEDLTALCREHHNSVHQWLYYHGEPVQATGEAIAFLKRSWQAKQPKPKPPTAKSLAMKDEIRQLLNDGVLHPALKGESIPATDEKKIERYLKLLRRAQKKGWRVAKGAVR